MRVSWEDLFCKQLEITQVIRNDNCKLIEENTDLKMHVKVLENELQYNLLEFGVKKARYERLQPYISKMFGWANFYNWVQKETP